MPGGASEAKLMVVVWVDVTVVEAVFKYVVVMPEVTVRVKVVSVTVVDTVDVTPIVDGTVVVPT